MSTRSLHVADAVGEERRAHQEHAEARQHEREPGGRHVEERQEAAEEHQRAPQVPDEDQHQHGRSPDEQERPEMLQAEARDPAPDEHLAHVAEVAREEDDDRDLRELRRLKLDRADLHREEGAVHLFADARQPRHEQEREAGGGDRVAVALEHAVVAQEHDRRHEQQQADDEPLRLLARELLVDAVDHHQAERGEHGREREQVRIGVGQASADEQVREDAAAEEEEPVGRRDLVGRFRPRDQDGREPRRHQERDGNQAEELTPASGEHQPSSSPRSTCLIRSTASPLPRRRWSSTRSRRVSGR